MFSIVNEQLTHFFPPGLNLYFTFLKKSSTTSSELKNYRNLYVSETQQNKFSIH